MSRISPAGVNGNLKIRMNKEKVNICFHSTALIAYMKFSENVSGLYQTMIYLIMKIFNLEVVRKLIYNVGITISHKTHMLFKIKLL